MYIFSANNVKAMFVYPPFMVLYEPNWENLYVTTVFNSTDKPDGHTDTKIMDFNRSSEKNFLDKNPFPTSF